MATETFGKYQLIRKLAMGGMAEIHLARQLGFEGFEKKLVVKRILPHLAENKEFVQMFLHEARVAARLNHANIAQIFDLGNVDGSYFIAMEYIHGEDVRRVTKQAEATRRELPVALTLRIVADACAGLDYAHKRLDEQGRPLDIVHRDVSPQNILVSFDGSVKVVDFGIAKAADQAVHTRSGVLKGKYSYMSPEQAQGRRLDCRTDVFAIGVVLWELLTGARLFKRSSDVATLNAVAECRVEPPSRVNGELPPALDALVMRALAKDPADRYQEAVQLQVAIEEFLVAHRQAASSAHLAAFMQDLYAERLADESRHSESGVGRSALSNSLQSLREEEARGRPRLISRSEQSPSAREATAAQRPGRLRSGATPSLREPEARPSREQEVLRPSREQDAPRPTRELRRTPPPMVRAPLAPFEPELDLPTGPMDAEELREATRAQLPELSQRSVSTSIAVPESTRSISSTEDSPVPSSFPAAGPRRERPASGRVGLEPSLVTSASPQDQGRSRTGLVMALVVGVALAGGGVGLWLRARTQPPVLHFSSEPAGAEVTLGTRVLCSATPCDVEGLPSGTATVTLAREGLVARSLVVSIPTSGRMEIPTVTLQPQAAVAAPAEPGAQPDAGQVEAPVAVGAPAPAVLKVESTPIGARVILDGREVGTTPLTLEVDRTGSARLRVEAEGHRAQERAITLTRGGLTEESLTLERRSAPVRNSTRPAGGRTAVKAPPTEAPGRGELGRLTVYVKPWAEVRCGPHNLGSTPFPPKELPVGTYQCTFTNPEYPPEVRTVRIAPGTGNPVVKVIFGG